MKLHDEDKQIENAIERLMIVFYMSTENYAEFKKRMKQGEK